MTQTIAPRVRTLVLLILAVAGALLAGAAPVSAHAALTGSDPAQGAVVDTAPSQVSLTFSEPIAVGDDSVRVLDPKGERVDKGAPANPSGTTYSVRLVSGLPDGTYTVAYQVVSADSHPVAGAFTFSIGAPSKTTVSVSAQGSDDGLVGWLYGFGRYVSYAGFVVLAGGAAFVLACWAPGARVRAVQRLVVSGWLALTAATLGLLMLRGSYTTSGKVGDVFDLELLGDVLQTKTGAALVSRLLLLAAAALFIAVLFGAYARTADAVEPERDAEDDGGGDDGGDRGGPDKRDLTFGLGLGGTVVAAGLAASWAMSEHASQGLQAGVAMPVDVVHLLAVAAWLGGLTALLVALYRAPVETPVGRDAVRRFSRLAFGSVVTLAVTGVYQSWRQLGSWSAFTDTRYGQLLLVKIALVAVMVAVAFLSRRWTRRLADARVSEAAEDAERTEAPERVEEAVRAEEAERAEATERAEEAERAEATERAEEAERAEATERAEEAERAEATERAEEAERAEATERAEEAERAEATERAEEAERAEATERAEEKQPAGTAPAEASGTSEVSEASMAIEAPKASGAEKAEAGQDSVRAAQLARQRAAAEAARRKRLRDADPNRFGLRRSVLAEAGVAVVLLAVTTVLTQTEPGRTEQDARAAAATSSSASATGQGSGAVSLTMPFDTGGKNGKGVVSIDLDPAQAGDNALHVYVEGPDGTPVDVPEVKIALTLAAQNIGPLPVAPDHVTTGHWSASRVQIPMAGDWKVEVTVRTSDIDQVTVSKNAQIG
ncbi:copper resistance protein CopC [Streptomyces sp. SMS_SU21]|uniref:copper resistance CopC/CopD family protein n=1 Tax=Streptomyces sp. SMS_SU21 TaxID=2069440 RepID=UPI001CD9ECF5|nr:copper resistance protein CopC [Streptomyces sp. SMS_SU21]MCA2199330.1 copper resistance protein CopC [Streptomyces sp. SMS_SU21]